MADIFLLGMRELKRLMIFVSSENMALRFL